MNIALLAVGFALLIKSADLLVRGALVLARRLGVSDLVIGLTVVAFGTSMPELFVNIFASAGGDTEIAIGNVVGSNIFNILVILGVTSVLYPLSVQKGTVWKEIPFSLLAVLVLGVIANDILFGGKGHSTITRIDGLILIAFFIGFLFYASGISKDLLICQTEENDRNGIVKTLLLIIFGLSGLAFGGRLVVDSAVNIAVRFGVSQSLIGLTIVAAGTSLPELATSAVAAYRKNADIAVGNIVGSNIFNILLILGVSSLIKPLPLPAGSNVDILVLIGASLVLFFSMFTGKYRMIDRWEGALFLLSYVVYSVYVVKRG